MSNWSFGISAPVLLLGLLLWGAAAWLCWANWDRSGRRSAMAWLEALRFVLITLLGFTLLRPEFIRRIERNESPQVLVLQDASASMQTRDIMTSNSVISRAEWLDQTRKQEFWKPLEKSARVGLEEFASPQTNAAPAHTEIGTDLNLALETVLQRNQNLKAVLLISDGDWNIGKSPVGTATRFAAEQIPIFTVAVGRETPVPDVLLEDISAPAYGLLGEQVAIPFKIRNHLAREIKTTVTLRDGDQVETSKELVIPASGELRETIVWAPRTVGDRNLRLDLPVESDESLSDNNSHEFRVNVRLETLKVLVVDSLPRWEYRYLRNALERDPGVEMNCVLFHPGMAAGGGRHYLDAFPNTKEVLSRYDVVFLGDVGIGDNELTEKDAELIKGLVEQQASGLIFLPGNRGRQLTLADSPLHELMPVVLETGKPEGVGLQNEAMLLLSTLGKGHLLTRFDADENSNDLIWRRLPGFYWSAAVEKSRPGSEVLAVHSALRNSWGRIPLLVTRSYGAGKVLFMGTDSAWRWRRGVEDKFHYRFWSQIVRWMAHKRHLAEKQGIRLTYSPETPATGDTIFLQTTVLDAAGFPIESGTVEGTIVSPAGRTEQLQFTALEGGWGVFKSSFTAQEGGPYKINIESEKHGRSLDSEIIITQPQREKLGQPINLPVLREIASITGGAAGNVDALNQIVEKISLLPEAKPIERRVRIWSNPWWGGLLLVLLGIYWTGRKIAGVI